MPGKKHTKQLPASSFSDTDTRLKVVDYIANKNVFKHRFDFEIGHLVKSPCRECETKMSLPKCSDDCSMLDKIHIILSEAVSCTRRY